MLDYIKTAPWFFWGMLLGIPICSLGVLCAIHMGAYSDNVVLEILALILIFLNIRSTRKCFQAVLEMHHLIRANILLDRKINHLLKSLDDYFKDK